MLIKELQKNEQLAPFISSDCCENDVCVVFDPSISEEDYIVIKIDDFYNTNVPSPDIPKSPDCLIILRCKENSFHVFIVELKNVQSQNANYLSRKNILEKFKTCLGDFMSNRFRDCFYDLNHQFQLQLILVAGNVTPAYTRNFSFDFLLSLPWLKFADKYYAIQGENPNPLIRPC